MRTVEDEHGQTTVLVLGLALVVFAVSGLAVDGTRAFIYRRTLQSAADAAALAAASELDQDAYYSTGGDRIALDPDGARRAAAESLSLRRLRVRAAVDAADDEVRVVVRGSVPTTFLRLVGIAELQVATEAVAEPVAGRAPP